MRLMKGFSFLLLMVLQLAGTTCFALPFKIVPNGALPTSIQPGEVLPASYIVTNNTASPRSGNFVKYLPPNVSINTGGANACGPVFNLTARNTPGDHCTLYLSVTGQVKANDPNPRNHLFVCFPGGATCAGTPYPLNVTGPTTILYGVTGQNGPTPYSLFTIDTTTGNATFVMSLTAGDGNIIGSDGTTLYHWTSSTTFFESINLQSLTTTPITVTGDPVGFVSGSVLFGNSFLVADQAPALYNFTTTGFATLINNTSGTIRGMACLDNRVYGVNGTDLVEIDPLNGSTINTIPITMPGHTITTALGLTINPETNVYYALLRIDGGNAPRTLSTINVTTGVATLIGNVDNGTGLFVSSIVFNPGRTNCGLV